MRNEIMVSIICNTYNHERYIRDTLDGFVMQKTDFLFEVLIHDDASTDQTANIIREYEAKYPNIIKPIYQTENQYSKDVSIDICFQYPRANGKYIAYCEGDDYWTDPRKLQKQVDAMEQHPELDMCAHGAIRVDAETKNKVDDIMPSPKDTILSVQEVIMGTGGYVATCSLLYRASLMQTVPNFQKHFPYDYALQIHGSLRGGMLFLADCMSAYRWLSLGSWTAQTASNKENLKEHYKQNSVMLSILDAETDFRYTKTIHTRIILDWVGLHRQISDLTLLLEKENREIFKSLPPITKAELIIRRYFPWLLKTASALYERIRHRK